MSEVKVNKISPRSGTNVQLGDSGDTITVPSGATLDASNATTTLPANVVTTTGTQTLTNKTIGSSQLTGALPALDGSALTGIPDTIAPTRHSIRPSLNLDFANSKALDPRITFTRASNATYYDGYTSVKAEENLVRYSQDFDNADWTKSNTTVTANSTTAPDGTTTAETLTETTSSSQHAIWDTQYYVLGNTYVHSIFVKANGRTKVQFIPQATASVCAINYDLSAVTSTTISGSPISHTITDVGNSWYRISVVFTAIGTGTGYIQLNLLDASSNSNYTGDGTSGVYLWGAQVEQRDSLTAYTATSGTAITKYQPALQTAGNNVARFDHNPTTGESLGLLIEESRTNLVNISEDISDASFTTTFITKQGSTLIAPDGTLTAGTITSTVGTTGMRLQKIATSSTGVAVTYSIYVKKGNNRYVTIGDRGESTEPWSTFDFDTESIIGSPIVTTVNSTSVGNGWYRISMTWTKQNASFAGIVAFKGAFTASNSTPSFTGTGYETIHIWGMQLEQGSFPTSYIKTTGSQVTRSVDNAVMTDITDWYKISEGTIYSEAHKSSGSSNAAIFEFNDDTFNNRYGFIYVTDTTLRFRSIAYGTNDANITQTVSSSEYTKASGIYKLNDFDFVTSDTNIVGSDTSAQIPINITRFTIGTTNNGFNSLNGHIKKLAYYPVTLTNSEIIDLTEE